MRQCAACEEEKSTHAVFWFGGNVVKSLCLSCYAAGWTFNDAGEVTRGLRGWVRDAMARTKTV